MNFNKKGTFIILLLSLIMLLAACSNPGESSDATTDENNAGTDNDDPITIGQINWPENIAVTNMWKVILEDEGYNVDLTLADMGVQMASVADGSLDVSPEVWLPVQDKSYYEEYKDQAEFAEDPWYDNGIVGLAVPEYMDDINSIEDLNDNKDKFNGEIIGFEPGAGTMEVTHDVINDYDLDLELVESSEAAMIQTIRAAVDNEEPIVAPLWQPHYIFSEVDMKFLDDPQNTYGETEEIFMATRDGFESDYEDVYKWMTNWELNDDELGSLMLDVQEEEENPIEGAKKWVEENQDVIDEWKE
ncbi:glycine betaine/proline transport system substrate-binding protein [Virgibacillus natechei]|uniref:Glycine betaine/proline transport system substrate-binding protein n=1 Tax=Virgibacillus natechei TaxID=1216297 RepID=A0ABS4IKE4_9BACI|nr:glycine betaine ABC transporter substrate-binding protein [Virgibacillus natechei]MBP1970806.1 glycine betaine/proline transport system substrate-binding protein [Virgibacillus natechei]UZD12297.1 glycine betaine ABC transporter substrate-binding protein [Virgibacillus natechei]